MSISQMQMQKQKLGTVTTFPEIQPLHVGARNQPRSCLTSKPRHSVTQTASKIGRIHSH